MPSAIVTDAQSAPSTTPITSGEDEESDLEVAKATPPPTNNESEKFKNDSDGSKAMPSSPVTNKEEEKPNNESDGEQPKQQSHMMPSAIMTNAQSAPSITPITGEEAKESDIEVAKATPPPTNNEREKSKNESDGNQATPSSPVANKEEEKPNNESDEKRPKQESHAMSSAIMTDAESAPSTTPVTSEEDKESDPEISKATPPPTNNEREMPENKNGGNQATPSSPVTNKEDEKPNNESDEEQPKQESHAMPSAIMTDTESAPSTTLVTSKEDKEGDPEVAHRTPPPTHNERDKSKNESDGNQATPSSPVTNKEDEKPNNESDEEQPKQESHAMPSAIMTDTESAPSTTLVTSKEDKEGDPEVAHRTPPPTHNERDKSKNESDGNQATPSSPVTNKEDEKPNNESDGERPKHHSDVIRRPVASPVMSNLDDHNIPNNDSDGEQPKQHLEVIQSPATSPVVSNLVHHNIHPPSKDCPSLPRELPERTENLTRQPTFSRGQSLAVLHHPSPITAHPHSTMEDQNEVGEKIGKRKRLSTKQNALGNETSWSSGTGIMRKKPRAANPQPIAHPAIAHHMFSKVHPKLNPPVMHHHQTTSNVLSPPMMSYQTPHPWTRPHLPPRPHVPAQGAQTSGKFAVPQIDPAHTRSIHQGRSLLVKLTLPSSNVSLGVILNTCTVFGLPELKGVETNSPADHQIPKDFQKNCCIFSLESQAIGYVQPKTAHQCVTLIAASREGCGSQLTVGLVQTNKTVAQPDPPQGTKVLTESKGVLPFLPGRSQLVKLTLPSPNVSLGILLDTCTTFGLPELKDVETNSPMKHQIPQGLQKNCYILSVESQAIGYVEPKTAEECAALITKSRKECGSQMKIRLVEKSKTEAQLHPTQGAEVLPEPMGARANPIPQGRSQLVELTLPPPNVSLGILLDTCTTFGLSELKEVETNSPVKNQIPKDFQKNCYILSIETQVIGYVEPKTAQQCATLIAVCQEERGSQMKVVLVQKSKIEAQCNPTQGTNVQAESRGGHMHATPQGRSRLVKLTLPPPNVSLGIFLDTCTTFGLPELKEVEANSPMSRQIPKEFQSNCYIMSVESQAIGYVEPKTAQQCATLITKSREECGSQMNVVLVQKSKTEAKPESPAPKANVPRVHADRHATLTKLSWSEEEDRQVVAHVKLYGSTVWGLIAKALPGRTGKQCRERWHYHLNPAISKAPMTEKEELISVKLPESSAPEANVPRVHADRHAAETKLSWSEEEDRQMVAHVKLYGSTGWSLIAKALPGRTGKQCRERWHYHLNPAISKAPWTEKEELITLKQPESSAPQAHVLRVHADRYATVTKLSWSEEEDRQVVAHVRHYGSTVWGLIAKALPGRTKKQCRERWRYHLNPAISKAPWTEKEDLIILKSQIDFKVMRHSSCCWTAISKRLPGRTDRAIRDRWRCMKQKVEKYLYSKNIGGIHRLYTKTGLLLIETDVKGCLRAVRLGEREKCQNSC